MFCPRCGNPDQSPETYCRQCGIFLPDLSKPVIAITEPEQHVTANLVLGSMTVITSFTLAILLYLFFLGLPEAPSVIYLMFGLLIAMGAWHIQTVWRSMLLRKHFKDNKARREQVSGVENAITGNETGKILKEADFEPYQAASVTDQTTRQLAAEKRRSS